MSAESAFVPCPWCRGGLRDYSGNAVPCSTPDCPGNPASTSKEDPRLVQAIRDAVIAEACRWRGIPEPRACGEFTRISDIYRYVRAALDALRKFEKARDSAE